MFREQPTDENNSDISIPKFDITIDYYSILHLENNATLDDIKTAYRKLVKENHPDLLRKETSETKENLAKLYNAYRVLKDPTARKKYDDIRDENPFKSIKLPIVDILFIQHNIWPKYKSIILSSGRLQDWQIDRFEGETLVVNKHLISLDPLLSVSKEVVFFITHANFTQIDVLSAIDSWDRKKLGNLNEVEVEILKTFVICALFV
jgi:DnaJ domain